MRARTIQESNTKGRLLDTIELQAYTSLGKDGAIMLGNEAGAKIKVGRRTLWDRAKLDQYLNELTGVE